MGREKTDEMNKEAGDKSDDSPVKSAFKSVLKVLSGGGEADKARKTVASTVDKQKQSIEDQTK